jgi:hypothetical protein
MTPYITLNLTERRLAEFIAKCRYETSRKKGIKNLKVSNEKVEITELEGIASELAFCKYMNVYPDLEIKVSDWDCVLPNGAKVDIKTTMYSTGKLLAHLNKKGKKIDVFVLALGKFPTYRFAGYALTADLIRDERITDLGYGPTYAMPQSDLRDIEELRD